MNYVKSLNLFGVEAKEIPCITGSGAPTTATVGAVGLLYMNTNNGDVYKCTAVSGSTYNWESMESASSDSGGNADQSGGMSTTAKNLLITILRNGTYSTDQSANITALASALASSDSGSSGDDSGEDSGETEKTLTGISAVYSGGEVTAGTAVNDLIGIVVTATYSDGSTANVTGYTLSGTIAEGENTVTVSYGGMTTTFTVTGVAESGGTTEPLEITLTDATFPVTATWSPYGNTFTLSDALIKDHTYRVELKVREYSSNNAYITVQTNGTTTAKFIYFDDTPGVLSLSKTVTATQYADGVTSISVACNKGTETSNQTAVIESFVIYDITE